MCVAGMKRNVERPGRQPTGLRWPRRVLFALAFLLPGMAVSQDLDFDIAHTLECTTRAVTYDEMRACVGTSADICMSATDMGGTTVGMGGCIDFELSYWDDRLNASYGGLRALEGAEDADLVGSAGFVSQADALRDMQRAWITYRDATCDYERAQWGGGTGGGPATLGCLMRLTGHQAIYLEQMKADY